MRITCKDETYDLPTPMAKEFIQKYGFQEVPPESINWGKKQQAYVEKISRNINDYYIDNKKSEEL